MKRLIFAILFVTLIINLTGCVVVDHQHKYARRVVVASPPPGHHPDRPVYPHHPNTNQNRGRSGRPGNRNLHR